METLPFTQQQKDKTAEIECAGGPGQSCHLRSRKLVPFTKALVTTLSHAHKSGPDVQADAAGGAGVRERERGQPASGSSLSLT